MKETENIIKLNIDNNIKCPARASRGLFEPLKIESIQGLYKIRKCNLDRIMKSELTDIKGNKCPGISNYELDAYIYLCQIADENGQINNYKYSELQKELTSHSKRTRAYININNSAWRDKRSCKATIYNVIHGLEHKGFIKVCKNSEHSSIDIKIINGAFPKNTDYKKSENYYLNLNISYLQSALPYYKDYARLKLNTKKLYLYLLYNYNSEIGYRADLDTIKDILNITRQGKIKCYIKELQAILGYKSIEIVKGKANNKIIWLKKGNINLVFESGINELCQTYFKRQIDLFIRNNKYIIQPARNIKKSEMLTEFKNELFSLVKVTHDKGQELKEIIKTISKALEYNHIIDEITNYNIQKAIKTAFP